MLDMKTGLFFFKTEGADGLHSDRGVAHKKPSRTRGQRKTYLLRYRYHNDY